MKTMMETKMKTTSNTNMKTRNTKLKPIMKTMM